MTTLDYTVRLFILVVFALTACAGFARAVVSDDARVLAGNLLVLSFAAVGTYAQIPMRSTPVNTTDWLRVAVCFVAIAYLATLARKGLK